MGSDVTHEAVKEIVHQKFKFCHHYVDPLIQNCMSFFVLLNTKEDILKTIGNQTVDGSH